MRIAHLTSRPGTTVRGALSVAGLRLPILLAQGTRPGPTLYLQALQHPTELIGVEVVRRVMDELDLTKLRGTVVASPIVNPLQAAWRAGLTQFGDFSSRERKRLEKVNLNRVWPGKANGNLIEQVAHAVWEQVVRQADAVVDLHCCRICDYYFAAARDGHAGSVALAQAWGAPLVDLQDEASYAPGMLFLEAPRLLDKPAILVEMSPGGDVVPEMLEHNLRGVWNVLKHLHLLPGRPHPPARQVLVRRSDPTTVFTAQREGYLTTYRQVGELMAKGELLCEIRDLQTFRVLQTVRAPFEGACPSLGPGSGLRLVKVGEEVCTFKRVVEGRGREIWDLLDAAVIRKRRNQPTRPLKEVLEEARFHRAKRKQTG
jgi:predicted deacylase